MFIDVGDRLLTFNLLKPIFIHGFCIMLAWSLDIHFLWSDFLMAMILLLSLKILILVLISRGILEQLQLAAHMIFLTQMFAVYLLLLLCNQILGTVFKTISFSCQCSIYNCLRLQQCFTLLVVNHISSVHTRTPRLMVCNIFFFLSYHSYILTWALWDPPPPPKWFFQPFHFFRDI